MSASRGGDDRARRRRRRILNGCYTWALHWAHGFADLLPPLIRVQVWKIMLEGCGRGVLMDQKIYFKYPWLVKLGDDVSINRGVEFYPGLIAKARIVVADGVRIAPNVRLHAAGHDPEHPELIETAADIHIGEGAWLGASCVVLPGVKVGKRAIIAAGAVVSRDVPDDAIVGGVPARVIRSRGVRP